MDFHLGTEDPLNMTDVKEIHSRDPECIVVNCDPWENTGVEEQEPPLGNSVLEKVPEHPGLPQKAEADKSFEYGQEHGSPAYSVNDKLCEYSDTIRTTEIESASEEAAPGELTCSCCTSVFTSKHSLTLHVFTHLEGVPQPPHIFDQCGQVFPTVGALGAHECDTAAVAPRVCDSLAAPKCDTCGKRFRELQDLLDHDRMHTRKRPHYCDICGKSYTKNSYLKDHKRIHTGERPFKCEICGSCFGAPNSLVQHTRTHTGEKPYSCDICKKSFSSSSYLGTHKRIHTGERPFECATCGKCFIKSGNLIEHNRTHTGEKPFSCDICGKKFGQTSSLRIHKRIHTGERPFKCKVCGKCFVDSGTLSKHNRVHSEKKLYSCDRCSRTFASKFSLQQHKCTHTG